jgi:hypothetical protein
MRDRRHGAVWAAHPDRRRQLPHSEAIDLYRRPDSGIGRVQDMEPAVEREAVHAISALAPADAIGGFEHDHLATAGRQFGGAPQARQPSSDHDHVVRLHEPSVEGRREAAIA